MHFLVDECCGPIVARWLRDEGYDARRVADSDAGMADRDVLEMARNENRVLVTTDKDFGARVFEHGESHRGVILLRLTDERPLAAIRVLAAG